MQKKKNETEINQRGKERQKRRNKRKDTKKTGKRQIKENELIKKHVDSEGQEGQIKRLRHP